MGAQRFDRLDALRALAMMWMVAFHFGFDLNHFGLLDPRQNFHRDPLWTTQRACIVSIFLFCAGIGQAAALQSGQSWTLFWRRWAQIAGCAILVSLASAAMFPRTWIHFGVLHGIAMMLIVSRLVAPLRAWLWMLGALTILLPQVVQLSLFDHPALNWIGLVTRKPLTEDYLPMLPWLGHMLWGVAAGQWLLQHRFAQVVAPIPKTLRPLATVGRWPLCVYMLHQPLLIGSILGGRAMSWFS